MVRFAVCTVFTFALVFATLALILEGTPAHGQVQPNIEAGFKSYGSYDSSKIDTVNLSNGGLTIHIPLPLSYAQRGGKINPSYFLVSNSKSWQIQQNSSPAPNNLYWNFGPAAGSTKIGEDPGSFGPYITNTLPRKMQRTYYFHSDQNGNVDETATDYSIRDWDDSVHLLTDISGGNSTSFASVDTSGFHVAASNPDSYGVPQTFVITDRRGNVSQVGGLVFDPCTHQISGGPNGQTTIICTGGPSLQAPTDSNGNVYGSQVQGSQPQDTLGRNLPLVATSSSSTAGCVSSVPLTGSTFYSYTGLNGVAEQLQTCLGNVTLQTNFGQSGILEYQNGGGSNPASMIVTLILPNNTKWTFNYDSYGNVTKLGLPTGGSISYTWQTISIPNCDNTAKVSRAVAFRTFYDGSNSYTWKYTWGTWSGVNGTVTNVVTDPLNNDVAHVFTEFACQAYETTTKSYKGSSTNGGQLLKEVDTTYSGASFNFCGNIGGCFGNVVPTYIKTTDYSNGMVTATAKSYDPGYGTNRPIFGNVTSESDYDWGSGAPGALLKQTATTYQFQNNSNYLSGNLPDLPASIIVSNGAGYKCSETDYTYDNPSYLTAANITQQHVSPPGPVRGNLNSTAQQLSSTPCQASSTWSPLTSYTNMYDTGEVYQSIDPLGHATTYNYSSTFYGAYPTTVTNALNQPTTYNYDLSTGLMTSVTDPNQQATTYSYDSMFRLFQVTHPDGGQDSISFQETADPFTATLTSLITSTQSKVTTNVFDGLGRVTQTQLTSDPESTDYTDISYDGMGRVKTHSNPHRSSSSTTDGTTTYVYDALGRAAQVLEPDGSAVNTSYSGNQTTVTDEVGNQRTSQTDALGRLTKVWEAPNASGYNYESDYQYDALNNLLCAVQKGTDTTAFTSCSAAPSTWRPRSFVYDSLSRLTSATNPESGTVAYSYDAGGNVRTKTAPSPNQAPSGNTVTTTYSYDVLNRISGKTYTDTYTSNPGTLPVKYGYDGVTITGCPTDQPPGDTDSYPIGRRTSMCDGSGATNWTHDKMGRINQENRDIGAVIGKHDTDVYNLDGSIATITSLGYGVSYTYSGAGRPIYVAGGNTYVQNNSVTYAAFGGLTGAKLGPQPITITNAYNNRLQPLLISAAASSTIMSLCYDFHLGVSVNSGPCSFSAYTSGDNGNIFQIVNNHDSNRTQNFLYDPLNRISQAYTSGPNWGETYSPTTTNPGVQPTLPGIDAWGNLTNRSGVAGKTYSEGLNAAPATIKNQLNGNCYDAAGNQVLNSPCPNGSFAPTYTYDAENRLIATAGMSYAYDGDGKRVEKCTEGSTPGLCANGATGTLYWTAWSNDPLAETDLAGNVLENYIFFNGQRIARREPTPTPTIHFYFSDHLGSHGMVTDKTGSTCEQDIDYYPYGGVQQDYCPSASQHYKFTGKERDAESGLDYFGARHNASGLGRFMSPDPVHILKQKLVDPQQWNMYAYVRNNPLRFVDPKGKWIQLMGTEEERSKQLQALQSAVGTQAGQYLYDHAVTTTDGDGNKVTNHYVGIRSNGPDGKGPSFGSINAAANKISGIVGDTHRGAIIVFDAPGPHSKEGSLNQGMSPAHSQAGSDWAVVRLTSGEIGTQRPDLQSNGQPYSPTLADVLSHEIGHVDAVWYHGSSGDVGDPIENGDSVRMENQTRQLNGEPLRLGHDAAGDVPLNGMPY